MNGTERTETLAELIWTCALHWQNLSGPAPLISRTYLDLRQIISIFGKLLSVILIFLQWNRFCSLQARAIRDL